MVSPTDYLHRFSQLNELQKRIITGILLVIVFVAVEFAGGVFFTALVILCAMLMILEWAEMTRDESARFRVGGFIYVLLPCLSLIMLRNMVFPNMADVDAETSPVPVLHLIAIVAATDTGAYIVGRSIGRHKIAPRISPGKTWEGLAGGALLAALVSVSFAPFLEFPPTETGCILLGALLALVAQAGDLFESWVKRRAGVKDSGTLLPGHGGVLDRVDGLMFAVPVYLFIAIVNGGIVL